MAKIIKFPTGEEIDPKDLGIEKSEYETLVTLDADLSHNIGDLQNGLEIFSKEDCDLILFSRHMHDSSFKERYLNFIVSKITNYFLRIISKIKINDYTNNFRIYKKSLFEHVEFNSTHFEILFEIIYRFNRLNDNLKIVEIPTIHQKREFGKSKKRHFWLKKDFFRKLKNSNLIEVDCNLSQIKVIN